MNQRNLSPEIIVEHPFPGLRPFETGDSQLFFGRDEQIDELLPRLARARFVAVTGDSGSGKSSLVRAGLIPALQLGYLSEEALEWRIAAFRPGNDPIGNLAGVLGNEVRAIRSKLEDNSLGLVKAAKDILSINESLLVLVDQFEEIFRYKTEDYTPENPAAAFVQLLLGAANQQEVPIYVVLTMRSDFLGQCIDFHGLAEALNGGQYLIPRMTRAQQKIAIESPIALGGAVITSRLVQRLLNDVADDVDQLPILQHVLMRMWEISNDGRSRGEPIDLSHYELVGGMARALDQHAEETYVELWLEQQRITQKIFQRLTETDKDGRIIRRPTELGKLSEVIGEEKTDIIEVIEKFRAPGRAFLTSPDFGQLEDHSIIDISHESLIRLWKRAHRWAEEEARSAEIYQRLARSALSGSAPYQEPDLGQALQWEEAAEPRSAWAEPYRVDFRRATAVEFRAAMAFLKRSKKQAQLWRTVKILVSLAAVFLLVAFMRARQQKFNATVARHLEAKADLLLHRQDFDTSALLAIESTRHAPSPEATQTIRDSLEFLPDLVLKEESRINATAFSPDQRRIATASHDKTARVFELANGKEVLRLNHEDAVAAVAFSPDGRGLATASFDRTVRLYDAVSGSEVWRVNEQGPVVAVLFSKDGRQVGTASYDGTARVLDARKGTEILNRKFGGPVTSIAFSPDGRLLATASSDQTARVFEVATGKEILNRRYDGAVAAVDFSNDGQRIIAGSADNTARVFEVNTGKMIAKFVHGGPVVAVAFSPDGSKAATGSYDNNARIFEVASGKELVNLTHQNWIDAVAFSSDGRLLATGSYDNTMRVMEISTGREMARITHQGVVRAVTFSPDGHRIATASDDQTARIVQTTSSMALARFPGPVVTFAVAVSPDGHLLAVSGTNHIVQIWDISRNSETLHLSQNDQVQDLVFSSDGRSLAIASYDNSLKVVEIATGKETFKTTFQGPVYAVAFGPGDRLLCAGGADRSARVFDLSSGREKLFRHHEHPVVDVAFSPNGRSIATASGDESARIFDVTTGKEIASLGNEDPVFAVAFGPDGRWLATGGKDSVRLFDIGTRKEIWLVRQPSRVSSISFSPDGRLISTAIDDNTARIFNTVDGKEIAHESFPGRIYAARFTEGGRIWETAFEEPGYVSVRQALLHPDDLIQAACSTLMRNLTPEEWKQYLQDEPYHKTCPNLP